MEERENGRANLQMRKKGLYIAPARNLTVAGFYPEIPAPLIKFPPPTEGCTTAREKGLSENSQGQKLWNPLPPEILAPGAEFPAWEKTSIRKRL
jgi:hypothetical protein